MINQDYLSELIKNRIKDVSSSCLVTSSRVWLEVGDLMSRDVATIAPDQSVLSAAKVMATDSISSLVVVDNGMVVGIITETDFLKKVVASGRNAEHVKVAEVMSRPVVSVTPDTNVFDAGGIAEEKKVKRLPVLDRGHLVGIVTRTDLVRILTSYGMWREISEIMSRDVATIYKQSSAAEAADVMSARGISGIVVTGTDGVVGILTERDFLKRVVATGKDPANVKVEEVMSYPVVTVPSYYSVFSTSRIMEKMHIRRLIIEDNKRLVGVVTQTDIFRAVEGRLREEEEDNFKLLETSDVCIYTLDLDGNVTYINPACMKLLAVEDRAEVIGQPFLPERFWYNPQDKFRFLKELKKGVVEIKDLTLKTARGRRIDVTVFSSFTKNIHGRLNGSQGVLHDFTDRKEIVTLKETEKALRASEDRYRRITEAVTDYIFTVRFEQGRPIETIHGETSVAVTGYTSEELTMDPGLWFNMVHPDDWELVRQQTSQCISGQEIKPIEHRIVRKDGSIRWVRRTLVRNCDSAGRLMSYEGLLQDVTELKLAEQVQMQLMTELEHTTQELADFSYITAHDLKAPLRGIGSLAGWLSTDYAEKLDEQGRENIRMLLSRVKRMYNLIDGVLQYTRITRTKEKKTTVDLNEVAAEEIAKISPPENVEIAIDEALPVVTCGRESIRQVIYNLLSNAVKYMDKPQGKVTIGWGEEDGCWKFSVTDNGCGIEKRHFGKIFKMFQTLSPRDKVEGTGVGLTIAKKIVESWGGRIWVESKPGEGSTFHFTLPKEEKHAKVSPSLAGVVG
jgi:PAS domain S-box-containing protein